MTGIKLTALLSTALTFIGSVPIINEDTVIPLGLVVAGVLLTARIVWKIAVKLTKTEDRIEHIENRQKQLDRRKDRPPDGGGGSNT